MSSAVVVGVVVAVAAVGVVAWWYSPDQQTKRRLKKEPVLRIPEAAGRGRARVTGWVVDQGLTLRGPLSGQPCAWYRLKIEQYRSSGRSGHWSTVVKEEQGADFLVDDGAGVARVRWCSPRVASPVESLSRSGAFDDPTPDERALLDRHGVEPSTFLGFNKTFRYSEAILRPGEKVTVLGEVRRNHEPRVPYEILATDEGELLLSDDPAAMG